jgi:hypothetical protein
MDHAFQIKGGFFGWKFSGFYAGSDFYQAQGRPAGVFRPS